MGSGSDRRRVATMVMTRTALHIKKMLVEFELVGEDVEIVIHRHNPQQLREGASSWWTPLSSGAVVGSLYSCRELIAAHRRGDEIVVDEEHGDFSLCLREAWT